MKSWVPSKYHGIWGRWLLFRKKSIENVPKHIPIDSESYIIAMNCVASDFTSMARLLSNCFLFSSFGKFVTYCLPTVIFFYITNFAAQGSRFSAYGSHLRCLTRFLSRRRVVLRWKIRCFSSHGRSSFTPIPFVGYRLPLQHSTRPSRSLSRSPARLSPDAIRFLDCIRTWLPGFEVFSASLTIQCLLSDASISSANGLASRCRFSSGKLQQYSIW